MKFLYAVSLTAFALMAQASSEPMITAIAKRDDSCVILPVGPTDTGLDSSLTISVPSKTTAVHRAAVTCEHAADPDGAMGLCPNLANGGWCDCDSAGTYEMAAGDNPCPYTTVPASGSISLSTTNCVAGTTVAP